MYGKDDSCGQSNSKKSQIVSEVYFLSKKQEISSTSFQEPNIKEKYHFVMRLRIKPHYLEVVRHMTELDCL